MNYCLFASKQGLLFESHALFEGVNIIGMGVNIVRICRKIKEYIERVKWELDDSPEALHIKARDKELCRLGEMALSDQISEKEFKKEFDRINRKYNYPN